MSRDTIFGECIACVRATRRTGELLSLLWLARPDKWIKTVVGISRPVWTVINCLQIFIRWWPFKITCDMSSSWIRQSPKRSVVKTGTTRWYIWYYRDEEESICILYTAKPILNAYVCKPRNRVNYMFLVPRICSGYMHILSVHLRFVSYIMCVWTIKF